MKYHRPTTIASRAFTLTELLISIAIALILLLGVNQIFKASSFTAGAGQAMSVANRDNMVVKSAMGEDVNGFARDVGMMIIRSEQRFAFRNAADKLADADGQPQTLELAGAQSPVIFPITAVNNRSHRLDRLAFFVRGNFTRQTADPNGNPQQLTSGDSSTEAWVWYGHLALPNNDWISQKSGGNPNFYNPSDSSSDNANNALACDWVLGRVATLLIPTQKVPPDYLFTNPRAPANLDPLIYSSTSGDSYKLYLNPCDVAATSISDYLQQNFGNIQLSGGIRYWYDSMIGFDGTKNPPREFWHAGSPFLQSPAPVAAGTTPKARVSPLSADYLSYCMVRGCAQFIVEYAGDYLRQNNDPTSPNYGQVDTSSAGVQSDGVIDFDVVRDRSNTVLGRKIRWYGYPRKTFNDGTANIGLHDVLPLCELMPNQTPAPFERVETYTDSNNVSTSYRTVNAFRVTGQNPFSSSYVYSPGWTQSATEPIAVIPGAYVCAWSPDMANMLPKMLRITIAIDDPNGRLAGPQFYEYTFSLQ